MSSLRGSRTSVRSTAGESGEPRGLHGAPAYASPERLRNEGDPGYRKGTRIALSMSTIAA